ncbi:MAG: nuclear transport factor 2 family protein [Sphingomonadaceae bacterium]|uniref:nuclear transport factor 2 family protein n=1 Tax=Thermaurantiacus sp. TaxID=2820283 RepID=UPI00298F3AEF|nr:nuclear transport factor 2 family protein [Thermaurantiacus sp.]MCS6985967.1 nuclear transport factor 2 family protein [Sphingomonadaceae bacterium]MDW8414817.1 nuclear transport factor 2 family protein [Thermaurantiacus sp.]
MDIREIAEDFARLCAEGRVQEAVRTYWSPDIATFEPVPGEWAETRGIEQAMAKMTWWRENHEIHEIDVEGPWVNGNQFTLYWEIEMTPKDGETEDLEEIVLYTVEDGKIVEERYFY